MKCFNTFILTSFISVNSMFATSFIPDWNGEARLKWTEWKDSHLMSAEAKGKFLFVDGDAWVEITPKIKIFDSSNDNLYDNVSLDLEKCSVGYSFISNLEREVCVELGRHKMEHLFDSKLQFGSMFNGLHFTYKTPNFHIHGGPHVINSLKDQYGAIAETSYQFTALPFKTTYSYSYWDDSVSDYHISQISFAYDFAQLNGKALTSYSAVLMNHNESDDNIGYYLGIKHGKIEAAKDYTLDLNIQHAEWKSLPCHDYNGIGGNGDGIEFKASYAVTDHFILSGKIVYNFDDSQYNWSELSAIYKW